MIRAAVYGLGRWGNRLTSAVSGSEKIRMTLGISRDPARHAEFSRTTGIEVVSSYARVLKRADIGAVVLATPHSLHSAQIIQAARAGKHVFVEKPFALSVRSAEKAIDACKEAGVTLAVGFNRRCAPAFVEMVRRIEAGEIGDIVHVEGQNSGATGHGLKAGYWRSSRKEAPGGGMTARGVHALDCMIRIAGHVASLYASSQKRALGPEVDIDDTTTLLLKFAHGASGSLTSIFVTGDYFRVAAFGTRGWMEMRSDDKLTIRGLEGPPRQIELPAIDIVRAGLEAFADAVAERRPFLIPPADIINGVAVLEAIEKSSTKKRALPIA